MRTPTMRRSFGLLVAMASLMALQMAGFSMFLPLFALRFESFGAGVRALATSDTAYALTFALAAPFIGMMADRFGRRPIILLSLTGYVLVFCGYLFAGAAWLLIALRGLAGIFAAGLLPGMIGIVGDLAAEDRRAQWIGIVNGGAAAGFVVGPLLGGLLYDRFGYAVPAGVAMAMAAGALLLATFRIPETHTLAPAARAGRGRPAWTLGWQALSARSTLILLMLITLVVMFAYAFVQPRLMFYAYDDLGMASTQVGLIMGAHGAAFMVCAFALGHLSDRVGRKPVLALGLALFSAQFVGLVLFRDVTWIAVSFVVAGVGNALYDPPLSAAVLDITPPEHTAAMLGVKGMTGSLGNTLGPAVAVLVAPLASPRVVFLVSAVLVIALVLVSGLFLRLPERSVHPVRIGPCGSSQPGIPEVRT